jgi:hypothetical protein
LTKEFVTMYSVNSWKKLSVISAAARSMSKISDVGDTHWLTLVVSGCDETSHYHKVSPVERPRRQGSLLKLYVAAAILRKYPCVFASWITGT